MGYGLEVEISTARPRDLLTAPTSSIPTRPANGRAGADVLVPHMGLTTGGRSAPESGTTLDEGAVRVQAMPTRPSG